MFIRILLQSALYFFNPVLTNLIKVGLKFLRSEPIRSNHGDSRRQRVRSGHH
jgi:hypothetical protein